MDRIDRGRGRRFARRLLWTGALCTLLASSASAYSWSTCEGRRLKWNRGWTNLYVSTTSFPASSSWDRRLQNAMWHWNNTKGASFVFYVGRDTDGSHRSGNGRSEVYLARGSGSALAVTKTRYHCYWWFGWKRGIDETDVEFDSRRSWSTAAYSYANPNGSPFNFESVALHEFGHALGLGHEDRSMATMNSFYPNSGPLGYYKEWDPFADDRQGVRYLYPDGTRETDVASSALERTGAGTSGLVSSPTWAYRGSYVTIEYSFSNLGTSRQTFDIGFFLSTNSYISTWDTRLGMGYGAWADPGATGTFTRTLYIPTWVQPGTYTLGFIVDPYNRSPENNESNNGQPMPRTIRIY